MWQTEQFEGTEEKDPVEQMLDFVNARHLQPGQFQFAVAADEEGNQFCVMLYTTEKPAAAQPEAGRRFGRPESEAGERPGRFTPSGGPPREGGGGGRRGFKPQFGPPGGGGGHGRPSGGRPRRPYSSGPGEGRSGGGPRRPRGGRPKGP